jgi:hypothetical protein
LKNRKIERKKTYKQKDEKTGKNKHFKIKDGRHKNRKKIFKKEKKKKLRTYIQINHLWQIALSFLSGLR